MTRVEAITEALATSGDVRVLWVDIDPIEARDAARGANRAAIDALPHGEHDAAVIGPLTGDLGEAVRAVRARVRRGGVIALVAPVERDGVRGAAQRALATFDAKRRPRALEDACAALLCAGIGPVKVIDVAGARGECVVYGFVAGCSSIG